MLTCYRSLKNYEQSPLLRLPQEILDRICKYALDDQVLYYTTLRGPTRFAVEDNMQLFGLPFTCRKLYQDTKEILHLLDPNITLRVVTFKYWSLHDRWQHPITPGSYAFFNALKALPHIDHFDLISVRPSGINLVEHMDHRFEGGFKWDFNYKARLKKTFKRVFPDATYSCRTIDDIGKI